MNFWISFRVTPLERVEDSLTFDINNRRAPFAFDSSREVVRYEKTETTLPV